MFSTSSYVCPSRGPRVWNGGVSGGWGGANLGRCLDTRLSLSKQITSDLLLQQQQQLGGEEVRQEGGGGGVTFSRRP